MQWYYFVLSFVSALQADLNKLVEWAQKGQMTFNSSKCVLLRVSRSVNADFFNEMMGRPLESVESHKYPGVEIDRKLSWNKHISDITEKGNRALDFIRRNLHSCPEEAKKQAYYSLVRPHLEYASSARDPHTQKNAKAIEGFLRRAARFVKCCYQREPGTVTKLLKDLEWPTLQQRRMKARLINFYKTMNIALEFSPQIQPKRRATRSYHADVLFSKAIEQICIKTPFP